MRLTSVVLAVLLLTVTQTAMASGTTGEGDGAQSACCARSATPERVGGGCGSSADPAVAAQKGETPAPSCGSAVPRSVKGEYRMLGSGGSVTFPFELVHEHVVIPVSVNGSEPFRLVLDTGMPFYGATLAPGPRTDALKLENPDGVGVMVAGMEDYTPRVGTGVTLGLPGIEFTDQMVSVIPLPGGAPANDALASEGVIGLSVFDSFVVQINYDDRVITLTEPDQFTYRGAGTEIPIRLGPIRMPEIVSAIETAGGSRVPVGLVVDTGAALAMTITLKPDDALSLPDGAKDLAVGFSSWGEVRGKLARVPSLTLGDLRLNEVLVTFYEQGARGVPPCGENGLVGSEVLQRFNVTFDYARERMFLEPGRRFGEPFEFNMTGIVFRRADEGRFQIVRVLPDTPASESGLMEGDVIVSVDGVPSSDCAEDSLRDAMKDDSSILRLRIARGDSEMDVALRPRRLI